MKHGKEYQSKQKFACVRTFLFARFRRYIAFDDTVNEESKIMTETSNQQKEGE
jgi:hypothetical protein